MIKTTIIIILVIALLYKADMHVVRTVIDGLPYYWNVITIEVSTFKDRHPMMMAFLPLLILILLGSMRGVR